MVSTYVWIQGDSLKLADFTAEDHHQNEEDEEERSQTCGHNDQYLHCRQHGVSWIEEGGPKEEILNTLTYITLHTIVMVVYSVM